MYKHQEKLTVKAEQNQFKFCKMSGLVLHDKENFRRNLRMKDAIGRDQHRSVLDA